MAKPRTKKATVRRKLVPSQPVYPWPFFEGGLESDASRLPTVVTVRNDVDSQTLVEARAGYEVTGNPIYAWYAAWYCWTNEIALPMWVKRYMLAIAAAVIDQSRAPMSTKRKKDNGTTVNKASQVAKSIGLDQAAFRRFATSERSKIDAFNVEFLRFGRIGIGDGSKRTFEKRLALGKRCVKQDTIISEAVVSGAGGKRTLQGRVALGNKIVRTRQQLLNSKKTP